MFQMRLALPHAPLPENAALLAELAVSGAKKINRIDLDYSPASLKHVDRILGKFHNEGLKPEQISETIFCFGCYVGEVLIRSNGGAWKMPFETDLPEGLRESTVMLVELDKGNVTNPIGKAYKRVESGEGDSLEYFYYVVTKG